MSKKVIKFSLSKQSINDAIKEIEKYKSDFKKKNEVFAERLKEYGISVIDTQMRGIPNPTGIGFWEGDPGTDSWNYKTASSEVIASGETATAFIRVSGKRLLYIEFGYGAVFMNPQNPKAAELGYGAGTNSPEGHWDDPKGWFYKGTDGKSHHTYGAPAYMPVYQTSEHIRNHIGDIERIAREVFGDG